MLLTLSSFPGAKLGGPPNPAASAESRHTPRRGATSGASYTSSTPPASLALHVRICWTLAPQPKTGSAAGLTGSTLARKGVCVPVRNPRRLGSATRELGIERLRNSMCSISTRQALPSNNAPPRGFLFVQHKPSTKQGSVSPVSVLGFALSPPPRTHHHVQDIKSWDPKQNVGCLFCSYIPL